MTPFGTLFDTYVAVDWSSRSKPAHGADSIWIAVLDGLGDVVLSNPRTRREAEAELRAVIAARSDRRTLVGIDVALGYPVGSADLFGVVEAGLPAWRSMWRAIAAAVTDDARNGNNRFDVAGELNLRSGEQAGPFWGCPPGRSIAGLAPTKPAGFAPGEFRGAERALRATGRSPMSVWQLNGSGSVGSQTLTAIPILQRLLDESPYTIDVWPFTTGVATPYVGTGGVVVAEVWPTMFDPPYPIGTIRDAAQVAHVARRCCEADADGSLPRWFTPAIPPDALAGVVAEEGWVLGAGLTT